MKMNYDCKSIVKWTEAQLKYTCDVSLREATPSSSTRPWARL